MVLAHCTIPLAMTDDLRLDTHFESGTGVAIKGYLREEDVTIFRLSADLKNYFVSDGKINCSPERKYVGINLSPLSLIELYGNISNGILRKHAELIQSIMDKTKLPAILIPHVIAPWDSDNDHSYMKKVISFIDSEHKNNIILTYPNSFFEAKEFLRQCRMLVAARMHCAINAMTECIPTILLSYSTKSIGIAELVYGNDNWVISLKENNYAVIDKAYEMSKNCDFITSYLFDRMSVLKNINNYDLNRNSIDRLRNIMTRNG